jgi:EAL domain-containing protein (putative c-di-GMP-specific phosphodiesterase class I)
VIATENYEAEHDQLVAVAFTASDLLVEVDDSGVIFFLAGAVHRIGVNAAQSPAGLLFVDLFDPSDRAAVRDHVARLISGVSVSPLLARLRRGAVPVMLFGGCRLPQGRTILFLGIGDHTNQRVGLPNLIAETERGLMSRPVFTALALRRLPDDLMSGLKLTFLEFADFTALGDHMPAATLWGLGTAIARHVHLNASGIEAVGDLGRGRYGVLHRGTIDLDRLRHTIAALVAAVAAKAPTPALSAVTLEPSRDELYGRQAARVIRYAIERFAGIGETGAPSPPTAALEELFPDTMNRVVSLEQVIENGAFDIAYQPVVDLAERQIRHAEALVRFGDNTPPLVAVATAEAAAMIADFDLAICARAISHLESGMPMAPAIAVNLSGRSLETRGFVDRLTALLEERQAPPLRLMFELTETAIVGEVESVNRVVQNLRQRGYRFCLDDLGSGANSFHYLRSIPVDFVKIDGAFGRDALQNERDRSFLRYVSGFCRENGILAIAEMIETEAQAEGYRELGIDYGQGYLFGRPLILRPSA